MSITSLPASAPLSKGPLNSSKPRIITIPDSTTSVSCPSSVSSSELSTYSSPRLLPPEPETVVKRRRINTRLAAKSIRAPITLDSESCSPLDSLPLPLSRLELNRSRLPAPPRPPPLPTEEFIQKSEPYVAYAFTPYVSCSSITNSDVGRQISTCIKCAQNPFSVSISSQPASKFAKPIGRATRPRHLNGVIRSNSSLFQPSTPGTSTQLSGFLRINATSSAPAPTSGTSTPIPTTNTEESEWQRERARDVEQNKWWNWAKICRTTGDSNESAQAAVLRCQDLEPEPETEIVTKRAVVCHLDGDITHPIDGSKWRLKAGL